MLFGKKKKEEEKKEEHKEEQDPEKLEEKDIKDRLQNGWIKANFIFEVIGKPADYVEESLKNLLDVLEKEKNAKVISREQHPSQVYEETLFSTFAEATILVENLRRFMNIVYDYMPSSIEITDPQELKIKYLDINVVMNELANSLHRHDIELKKLQFERNFLRNKLEELDEKLREEKEKEEKSSN